MISFQRILYEKGGDKELIYSRENLETVPYPSDQGQHEQW